MKHAITVAGVVLVALTWLTPIVTRVLDLVWPVFAAALVLVASAGAVALSVYMLGRAFGTLRTPPTPIEILPGSPFQHAFARDITPPPPAVRDPESHRAQWDTGVMMFVYAGDLVGFSVRSMKPYISRDKRQIYVDLLIGVSVLVSDSEGTRWALGWNRFGLRTALKRQLISPPYPKTDPPAVHLWIPDPHAQHPQHSTPGTASTPGGMVVTSPMRR
jgi:hypothetical protein